MVCVPSSAVFFPVLFKSAITKLQHAAGLHNTVLWETLPGMHIVHLKNNLSWMYEHDIMFSVFIKLLNIKCGTITAGMNMIRQHTLLIISLTPPLSCIFS